MEPQKLSPGKFARNYGIVLGVILIFIAVIMYVTGLQLEGVQWPMYIYYIIFPVIIFYAISQYKKAQGNVLTLGDAIKTGLAVTIISALVYAVYNLLFNYVIDPEFMKEVVQAELDRMLESGKMTQEMIDQTAKVREIFTNPFVGTTIWIALSALFGLIYSLIAGLIMKREES